MMERNWMTDYEIDQYIEATKDLFRVESLEDLRARLIRQRDEVLARPPVTKLRNEHQSVPGRMSFTVLERKG